jgi:hypothetical protein
VGHGYDGQQLFAHDGERLGIAFDHCLERLLALPVRVLRCQRSHPIDRKGELDIDRLLGPQRAVVVEGCDALGCRHELGAGLERHAGNEVGDGPFCGAVIPGRQRIGCGLLRRAAAGAGEQDRYEHSPSCHDVEHGEALPLDARPDCHTPAGRRPSSATADRALLQLLHDPIDTEARWPLSWRKLSERRDELPNDLLCRHNQERARRT